jgi:serine/threonine protein kinase
MSEPTVTGAPESDGPTVTASGGGADALIDAHAAPSGYDLHTLIGSGGMGAVYRARDLELARDVAVKFLHLRYAPDSVTARRFAEEARITAQLQHPGIPAVYRVGRTADGRPFLAMKLIKGETLEDQLKARNTLANDRGRFIGTFEKVADAVAVAHSRRIIHRDLKPANVMVGDFGEVQVMDWGLAKELSEATDPTPAQSDETLSVELRAGSDRGDATQAGSLLGTPAYIPPEQAVGAIGQITERSDVFGLGAILCVILTGKPPFVSDSAESARVLAAREARRVPGAARRLWRGTGTGHAGETVSECRAERPARERRRSR